MKILQVINSLATGGAEKLLLDTVPLFNKLGVQMDVLLLWDNNCPFVDALDALKCCNIYILNDSENINDVYNPLNILKIRPYLNQYDIVHVHLFPAQYYVVAANLLNIKKSKLVFTEHSTNNKRLSNPVFRFFDKYIYRGYSKVIAISDEIKDILFKHTKLVDERFSVINNGINLEAIKRAELLNKSDISSGWENSKIIAQVAAFREGKDQATLIKAMCCLPDDVKLMLVGEGQTQARCKELVDELKLQDRVLFLGMRMDVPQLIKTADVNVLSSQFEGLSLSCIEGMASGKPFIASDVPGLKDIVGGAGVLFPLGDFKQLAVSIEKLLNEPEYNKSIVAACQERADNYDNSKMVDKQINLYKNLIK